MKTSIASVSFRAMSIAEIATLARTAGLNAVEWGGDIHVPPNNIQATKMAASQCKENGLEISAYGSYYKADGSEFEPILHTALNMNCQVVRVWAGALSSSECSAYEYCTITENLTKAVNLAKTEGVVVATEYHANTLTDTLSSTAKLLDDVSGLRTFWQPPIGVSLDDNLLALQSLHGQIENIHTYHRDNQGACRPLSEGADNWRQYLSAPHMCSKNSYATLEFVMDNSKTQLLQDATVLKKLVEDMNK